MTNKQKEYYAQMKSTLKWSEIAEIVNADLGTNYDDRTMRDILRRTYERVSSSGERKPRYEVLEGSYKVFYANGKQSVTITEEALEEAFTLYCIAGLTLEQVHLKMHLTRREFYALLKAFDIVKTSLPVTPLMLETMDSEQIAEQIRIKKLRYSHEKLDASKHIDQKKRIEQMDKADYWYSKIVDNLTSYKPELFKNFPICYPTTKDSEIIVVYVCDVHAGLEVKNYFNNYDIKQMKEQFKQLASYLIQNYNSKQIIICDLGDTIHGHIHGSVKTYSIPVSDAVTEVINIYTDFLLTVAKHCNVSFSKVNGSHESIEKVKTDRTEENSFGNIIYDCLKYRLSKIITFIDRLDGLNIAIVPIFDKSAMLAHGDNTGLQGIKDAERLFRQFNVFEIEMGHFHHLKVEDMNGITLYYNEPFCGTDQFAAKILKSSQKGTRIVTYNKYGRKSEELLRYE